MTTLTFTPTRTVEVDEATARRELRRQIAEVESRIGRAPGIAAGGPRLLDLAALAAVRDKLLATEAAERETRLAEADAVASHRALLEDAREHPHRHRGLRIPLATLGEPGCGVYQVRPRLGIIGMLAGWWEMTLSSGCP